MRQSTYCEKTGGAPGRRETFENLFVENGVSPVRGAYEGLELPDTGDPWRNLALAVVARGMVDYLEALEYLRDRPLPPREIAARRRWERVRASLRECEAFFAGEWYAVLTDMRPEHLRRLLWAQAGVTEDMVKGWCGDGSGD